MSTSYRRVIVPKFGPADVLAVETVETPPLGAKQVRVEVHFIGINYADTLARRGYYKWAGDPPFAPGFEVSGVITEVGSESRFKVGDTVMVFSRFGGYAEILTADEERVFVLPHGMSLQEAAAVPAVYATAHHALYEVMRVREGESILIQAVAGGVGLAALQLAKHSGLVTYGTASSPEKLAFAAEHGLDHGIDYSKVDFEEEIARLTDKQGVRFVLDSLGGEGFRKGYRCLSSPGHALVIGGAGIVPPESTFSVEGVLEWTRVISDFVKGGVFHPFPLIVENKAVSGMQILLLWDQLEYLRGVGERILELYTKGAIKPFVHEIFPLTEAAEAHRFIEGRRSKGKLLLSTESAHV
ncbi:MAG: zinc-binding dehydrogenase [Myxococcota bacterium]